MNTSISVSIRIRPHNEKEVKDLCVKTKDNKTLFYYPSESNYEKFNFDFVANQQTTQEEIFKEIGIPLIETALNGYN